MKRCKHPFLVLVVTLAVVLILNMTVMYVFSGINILNPRILFQNGEGTSLKDEGVLLTPRMDTKTVEINTSLVSDPVNRSEKNMKTDQDVILANSYYMTSEEVAFLSQLSLEDKLSAMAILTKLEVEDRNRIFEMAYDGVTIAEYDELNESIDSKLEEYDVEAIKRILHKSKMLYAQIGQ